MPENSPKKDKDKKKEKKDEKIPVLRMQSESMSDVKRVLHHKWGVKLKGAENFLDPPETTFKIPKSLDEAVAASKLRLTLITRGTLSAEEVYIRRAEKDNRPLQFNEELQKILDENSEEVEEEAPDNESSVWRMFAESSTKRSHFEKDEIKPVELREVESISIRPEPAKPKIGV